MANTVLTIAIAIYLETALAFLGLEDPTVTTWGTILEHAFERTAISSGAWWAIVPAGFLIAIVIVGCFLLGQAIEDALNPRLKVAHLSVRRWRIRPLAGRGPGRDMSLLEVSDLHVWFDLPQGQQVHAVQGVSFALDPGERFGLVGESGCGKTTTILATMGLLPPNASVSGEVRVDGQNILAGGEDSARGYRWKDIAMVFQGAMNALNPVKKVGWQIAEPMAFHGIAQGAAARRRRRAARDGRHSGRRPRSVTRTSSPAACGSARRSPWRWPASPGSCWPTSPPRRWT